MKPIRGFDTASISMILALLVADACCWCQVLFPGLSGNAHVPRMAFLDVGQGDSEVAIFPGNVKVMTDAGPDAKVLESLGNALGDNDHYIDLAIISHPQSDHFAGFSAVLDHYQIGAFIYNGRDDASGTKAWPALLAKIREKGIPLITLGKGDRIVSGKNSIAMLSPDGDFAASAELNDTGFVEMITMDGGLRTLLTADTEAAVENALLAKHADIRADILKVGHHGSKHASGNAFLGAVNPRIAVIEVGAKNTYGHPTKEALVRIASSTRARIMRTDKDGTVQAWIDQGSLIARKSK